MEGKLVKLEGFTPYYGIEVNGYMLRLSVHDYNVLMLRCNIEGDHGSGRAKKALKEVLGI